MCSISLKPLIVSRKRGWGLVIACYSDLEVLNEVGTNGRAAVVWSRLETMRVGTVSGLDE